ncbi:hypothetical protein [Bacillus xiapuensis]|uniref:Uncharacterized protein n=1 Tax=Bacillus xiapuensis TaxID=2014075 RepID=A0ABU6N8C5_9BACI|nr:hypothetical protein [Bacillus xiapuensis]
MTTIQGRNTLAAFNSVGIAYAWDTNIKSVTEENGIVTVIHKPKGKKTFYKHTYTKDQEMKIYKGWLNVDLMKWEMESYEENAFEKLNQYQDKLLYVM